VLPAVLGAVVEGQAATRVAEGVVDQAELRVDRRVHPRGRPAGPPRVAFPGVVAELTWPRYAPEVPDDVTVVGIDTQCRTFVAVVGAQIQPTVVVRDGDLLDVAVAVDLALPDDLPGLLVERDDPVAPALGEDLAATDGDTAPGQGATGLLVAPLRHAGLAVDGDDVAQCGFDEDSAIDHHGCALAVARFETTLDPVVPGTAELADVSAVDAGQCGVVLVAEVSTDLGEVLVAGGVVPGQRRCWRAWLVRRASPGRAGGSQLEH